jgi:ABC-2 type transport system permease protein
VLPAPIAAAASWIPLTHFLDAFRAEYGFVSAFRAPVATGLGLALLYAALAHGAFFLSVRRARQSGLLLKMSE